MQINQWVDDHVMCCLLEFSAIDWFRTSDTESLFCFVEGHATVEKNLF